jgi:cytochrome P450
MLTQFLAGHDTTLHTLTNLVWLLASYPEVLQRCREEQRGAGVREPLSLEDLREMSYLHQVIHECMRYVPPVVGLSRVAIRDVAYGGYRIPRGWTVMLSIAGTHRASPWTDVERFDPDRMGPARAEHRQRPNALIPFGGGTRVCLGQHLALTEMAIILSLMLRGYRWELVPGQDLSLVPLPFPHPRDGVRVRFSRL